MTTATAEDTLILPDGLCGFLKDQLFLEIPLETVTGWKTKQRESVRKWADAIISKADGSDDKLPRKPKVVVEFMNDEQKKDFVGALIVARENAGAELDSEQRDALLDAANRRLMRISEAKKNAGECKIRWEDLKKETKEAREEYDAAVSVLLSEIDRADDPQKELPFPEDSPEVAEAGAEETGTDIDELGLPKKYAKRIRDCDFTTIELIEKLIDSDGVAAFEIQAGLSANAATAVSSAIQQYRDSQRLPDVERSDVDATTESGEGVSVDSGANLGSENEDDPLGNYPVEKIGITKTQKKKLNAEKIKTVADLEAFIADGKFIPGSIKGIGDAAISKITDAVVAYRKAVAA